MGPLKCLSFSGAAALGIEWLKKKSPLNILIPFHHLVSDEPVPAIERLYSFKNSRQFEEDLDYLLRHFKPVSVSDIIDREKSGIPFKDQRFLLTFDDGLRQVYEVVAPILWRKGVPAALFVNPSFVDNKELFYDLKKGLLLDKLAGFAGLAVQPPDTSRLTGYPSRLPPGLRPLEQILAEAGNIFGQVFFSCAELETAVRSIHYLNKGLADKLGCLLELDFESFRREKKPFMTKEEIKTLAGKDFFIGAHSIDHPLYSLVGLQEQLRQTLESVDWVAGIFGQSYRIFAFPHVDTGVSHGFFQQLMGAETSPSALDLILGNSTGMMEKHPRVLHRFIGENPAIPAEKMVKAVLAYSILRKNLGKSYVKRQW
jgi:peptidoglycan/xylan/chitin deacetylase (PgdA/CDA1 family)